jgi:hypothetical protein
MLPPWASPYASRDERGVDLFDGLHPGIERENALNPEPRRDGALMSAARIREN